MPRRPETWVSLCNLILKLRGISRSHFPRVTIGIGMVIGKEKFYDFHGHPISISGHNIIGLIAVWYIDITEDIVTFVLAKITSCDKRVKYYV